MTAKNTEGQAVFDVGIGTLSSNRQLFIHAESCISKKEV